VVTGPGGVFNSLYDVVAIAAGADHSMALMSNGVVLTWGYNSNGQLGDTTLDNNSYAATAPQISSPTVPTARFTSTPAASTASGSISFTFVADQLNSSFYCSLDGEPYYSCTSPYQSNVGAGNHTFGIRTTLSSPPISYSWTVDGCGFKIGIYCYATIDDAYYAVQNNDTIKVRSSAITSLANFSRADNVAFTLQGGFESTFTTPSSAPSIFPALTISTGRVTARDLVIR